MLMFGRCMSSKNKSNSDTLHASASDAYSSPQMLSEARNEMVDI